MSTDENSKQLVFTNNWFAANTSDIWNALMPMIGPRKLLEIGAFEGASTCYLITKLASNYPIELHCIDNWQGGLEHQPGGGAESDMQQVEARFAHNTQLAMASAAHKVDLFIHKGNSDEQLSRLIATGLSESFDFVFIDGSHQAPDVICDAVLAFRLLKIGGVIGFDDYLWSEALPYGSDPLRSPKLAIDAFTSIYYRKLALYRHPNHQVYARKTAA